LFEPQSNIWLNLPTICWAGLLSQLSYLYKMSFSKDVDFFAAEF